MIKTKIIYYVIILICLYLIFTSFIFISKINNFNNNYFYNQFKKVYYDKDINLTKDVFDRWKIFNLISKNLILSNKKYFIKINDRNWEIFNYKRYFNSDLTRTIYSKYWFILEKENFDIFLQKNNFVWFKIICDNFTLKSNLYFKDYFIITIYLIIKFNDNNDIIKIVKPVYIDLKKYIIFFKPYKLSFLLKNEKYINSMNYNINIFNDFLINNKKNDSPFIIKSLDKMLKNYSVENINKIVNSILNQIYLKIKIFTGIKNYEKEISLYDIIHNK